jgi:hypothetical protein
MYNKKKKLLLLYSLVTIFYFINLLVCYAGEHGVTHWFWYQFITVMLVNMKYPKKKKKIIGVQKIYIFLFTRHFLFKDKCFDMFNFNIQYFI